MKCKECKTKMCLMIGTIQLIPDNEPYKAGEIINLDLRVEKNVYCNYCEKCRTIFDLEID